MTRGNPGEAHHKTRHTDNDVALALALRAMGWTYEQIAAKLDATKSTVAGWVQGRRRGRCA